MYFATRTSRGKQILQLLESYRNADSQPRNRVVPSLYLQRHAIGREFCDDVTLEDNRAPGFAGGSGERGEMVPGRGIEPPAQSLGNSCSIH